MTFDTDTQQTTDATIVSETTAAPPPAPNPLAAVSALALPDQAVVMRSPTALSRQAEAHVITNAQEREFAVEDLQAIKERLQTLDAERRKITDPLNAATKAVNALFKPATELLEAADRKLRAKVLAFDDAESRKAAEARAKAEAEAREAARVAAEAAAKVAAEAEAAARALEAEAAKAAQTGDFAQAAAIELEAATVQQVATTAVAEAQAIVHAPPPPPAYTAAAKTGTASGKKYTAELVSLHELVKHIATHPEYLNLVELNQRAANDMAKALKTSMNVPGLRVIGASTLTVRSKAA
jgi:colicin import membrane protein